MNITVITVGKLKEKYWVQGVAEYSKRLNSYCKLNIVELKETRLPDNPSPAQEDAVKESEGLEILKSIKDGMFVITLEVGGKMLSSEELADKLDSLAISGKSNIAFVIGGSLGLGSNIRKRSDFALSFSKMTFPHQMMRLVLLEQIYRSFKILKNEAYHK